MVSEVWVQDKAKNDFLTMIKKQSSYLSLKEISNLIDQDAQDHLNTLIKQSTMKIISGSIDNIKDNQMVILETDTADIAENTFKNFFNRVAVIRTFTNNEDLSKLSNIPNYTTSVGIYSKNDNKIENIIQNTDLCNISVNCLPETDFRVPKGSGANSQLGKFMGKYSFTNLVNMKPIFINNN